MKGEFRIDLFQRIKHAFPDMQGIRPQFFSGFFYVKDTIVDELTVIG